MANREVIAVIEPGQRVTVRLVAQRPGETYAQALARQNDRGARIGVAVATIQAEGARRLYSELKTQNVCNGQGRMSQRYFAEQQAARAY